MDQPLSPEESAQLISILFSHEETTFASVLCQFSSSFPDDADAGLRARCAVVLLLRVRKDGAQAKLLCTPPTGDMHAVPPQAAIEYP